MKKTLKSFINLIVHIPNKQSIPLNILYKTPLKSQKHFGSFWPKLHKPTLGCPSSAPQVITSAADPAPSPKVISELADAYAVAELEGDVPNSHWLGDEKMVLLEFALRIRAEL